MIKILLSDVNPQNQACLEGCVTPRLNFCIYLFENDFYVHVVNYFSNLPCALFTLDLLIWCAIFSVNTYKKNSFFLKKSLKESIMFYLRVTNYFSSSTPHNQRVLFFIKITVFCRLSFENMRFFKFCLEILLVWESIFGLKESIKGVWGSIASESCSVPD